VPIVPRRTPEEQEIIDRVRRWKDRDLTRQGINEAHRGWRTAGARSLVISKHASGGLSPAA
jgi:hypothetical protein